RRLRDSRSQPFGVDGRLVDSRTRHSSNGYRSEDVGAQSVSTEPRREESLRGRREQPRECLVPEPDLDDHGARVALVRLSGERIPERKPVMSAEDNELSRRDVIKLGAAATVAASLGVAHVEAQARTGGFLTESEFATLDELSELIIPSDAQS